jgi:GntR family transcriptional regulator
MTAEETERRPKYQRIAAGLREAIRTGVYGPGERLPGENELMAQHGVARMTVRQALGVLQNEGLAESRKGAGVFVRGFRPLRRRGVQRLAAGQWMAGRSVWETDTEDRTLVVDQLEVTEGKASAPVGGVLGIEPGTPVCVRSRRYVLDGKPVMTAVSYLPADLVAGSAITRPDTGPGGILARLAELGHTPARFREEIRCRMPDQDESRRLSLSPGTPVVLICRTASTADGTPVEYTEMILDSSSYLLEYDIDA